MSNQSNAPNRLVLASLPKELVRGEEQPFLDQLLPEVRGAAVALDFASVGRIDAAGIAALITVYAEACKAGHRFVLVNASDRVREILARVGLAGYLLEEGAAAQPCVDPELVPSAA